MPSEDSPCWTWNGEPANFQGNAWTRACLIMDWAGCRRACMPHECQLSYGKSCPTWIGMLADLNAC
eukprot:scaffold129467_cov15-Tisochrysis_lutea.AAC.1